MAKTLKEVLFSPPLPPPPHTPPLCNSNRATRVSIKVEIERRGEGGGALIQYRHFETMVCELATTEKK